jgi:hypothetical protein
MVEIMVTMTVEITTGGHASPRPPTCYVLLLLPMSKSAGLQKRQLLLLQLQVLCGGGPGPGRELTGTAAILLRSSATRSSLITILLLQPVFFLRPWARRKLKTGTGTVVIGQRQWRCLIGGEPKNTVGLVTRQPHFSINSNLTLKVTALSNRRFLGGPRFLKISFLGVDFSKKLKSWSPW